MQSPPELMPFQMDAFNADFYIEEQFLQLKERFKITAAVETGTCFGSTTLFLAKNFTIVATVENVEQYLNHAKERFKDYKNIRAYLGDSKALMVNMIRENKLGHNTIFFLDAHWGASCPLPEELAAIASAGLRPVIAIHDFKVPNEPALGFDTWDKQEFTFEWLKPYFDKIYGPYNYAYHYNSNEKSTQIKRGIIYVYPAGPDAAAEPARQLASPAPIQSVQLPVAGEQMVNLYLSYYNDSDPQRQAELSYCIAQNIANPRINRIYLVVDDPKANLFDFDKFNKVKVIKQDGPRPSYNDLFDIMNKHLQHSNDISILANTDIYFEFDAIDLIQKNLTHPSLCFALSAYDRTADGQLQILKQNVGEAGWVTKNDSQDTWIFFGLIKKVPNCLFSMGKPGCDNAIAACLEKAGYWVVNPAMTIKTIHLHISAIRRYDTKDYSKTPGGTNPDRVYQDYKMLPPGDLSIIPSLPAEVIKQPVAVVAHVADNWPDVIIKICEESKQTAQFSQFEEEAIILFIFEHIGSGNKFFVDLGAGAYDQATMSNTRRLKELGWKGFGVDAGQASDPWVIKEFIKPENIVDILKSQSTPQNFAFLNLDIDSSDFWVLKEILKHYKPRLICTEFNGTLDPNVSVVLKYEDGYTWDRTAKYGYSFAAGKKLLEENGYVIVYNLHNTDIFAVRKDLMDGVEATVVAERNQYHPANPKAIWVDY